MKASTIVMASEPPVTESVSKLSELDHVPDASIKVFAQHVGIESLADEVARALAPDVEYRLREVIQDACKFMRHSKRTELSTDDINSSLVMRRCEPVYGFPAGAGPIPFHEVPGHPELYIPENKIIDLKDILAAKLPRPPIAVNVVPHWLAVEGVQPLIPENPAPRPNVDRTPGVDSTEHDRLFRSPVIPGDVKPPPGATAVKPEVGAGGGAVMQPVVAHELSKELQLYFDRITAVVRGGGGADGAEAPVLRAALESLATDSGLHQLLPYFTQFVQDEVATSLRNMPRLKALVGMIEALCSNPEIHVELYLHQLMPTLITCMVAKRLSAEPDEDHWSLRRYSAEVMSGICARFGKDYPTIQPRITRTLLRAMLDPRKPFPTHFGAVSGLAALGPRVTRLLIVPNLKAYLEVLEPHLVEAPTPLPPDGGAVTEAETREHAKRRVMSAEARRVHDALKEAIGACLHAALAAKQREERERKDPERRAELMRKEYPEPGAGKGKEKGKEKPAPVPASVVKGWTIAKNTLRVDVAASGRGGAAPVDSAAGEPPEKKSPPSRRGKRKAAGGSSKDVDDGEENAAVNAVELAIDPTATEGEESEDPIAVAAKVAAAAALLGDCVMPYASNPTVADTFL